MPARSLSQAKQSTGADGQNAGVLAAAHRWRYERPTSLICDQEGRHADWQARSASEGDFVEVTSRRGKAVAQCGVRDTIRAGTCFLPFHWGRRFGFYKSANNLTLSGRDPLSHQPELKACAVRLRPLVEMAR